MRPPLSPDEAYLNDRVWIYRNFLELEHASQVLAQLSKEIKWLQKSYDNNGSPVLLPRLTANYGEHSYDYSGFVFEPEPWTPLLQRLKARIEATTKLSFNALVLQYYRDGKDSVGWHSDDDPCVGENPQIASLSLGGTCLFQLRHKQEHSQRLALTLHSGDFLWMRGDLQHTHVHRVPKQARRAARINLTFRQVIAASST